MDAILIRHAAAVDETLELRDPSRMLSEPGRAQARALAARLRERAGAVTHAWTSPLVRAVQTAELVVAGIGATCAVDVQPCLAHGESQPVVERALRALPATALVLVFGHEPGLSELAALLAGVPEVDALAKAEALLIRDGRLDWRL